MTEDAARGSGAGGMGGDTSAAGGPAQGSDAAADAALSRAAGTESDGQPDRDHDPGTPTTEGESWRPGGHYLAHVAVEMDEITGIDVVADDFDDEYQEAAALAKVRSLLDTTARFDALAEPLAETLPADEHGAFRGTLTAPDEGRPTAEIRIVHDHPAEDEPEPRTAAAG